MQEESATPLHQYVFGDTDSFALTIDVFSDGKEPYQARAWEDGETTALEYFTTFDECVAWFRTFPTVQEHDCDPGNEPVVVGLAPQSIDGGQTDTWTLIDSAHVDTWWDDSDFSSGRRIILFDDLKEETPNTAFKI
jgi:hypothetical protein